jgi:hypothetical protein
MTRKWVYGQILDEPLKSAKGVPVYEAAPVEAVPDTLQRYTYKPGVYHRDRGWLPGMQEDAEGDWVRWRDVQQALGAQGKGEGDDVGK